MEQSINIPKLKFLFEKLRILNYKYEKLEKANSFNLFSILYKSHDEVKLHSKFIAEILNPLGSHNMGSKFLKTFIEQCKIDDFVIDKATVLTEYRDIDIFIRSADGKQGVIIENKIYAGDQYKQLEKYSKIIKGEGYKSISIFYLTLDGHEPTEISVGELEKEQIQLLSYQVDILNWIERCIEMSALLPPIRETLYQYFNLIKELTNQSFMEEHIKDLMALLAKEDNAIQAKAIADNWKHIRWHTEYNFWNELETRLNQNGFVICDEQKWSEHSITRAVHYQRGREYWYGLMVNIFSKDSYSFRMFVERGNENLYYGVNLYKEGKRSKDFSDSELSFADEISKLFKKGQTHWWLGWNYIEPKISFETFNEEATKLINNEYRVNFIDNLVIEITEFINKCKSILEAANKVPTDF